MAMEDVDEAFMIWLVAELREMRVNNTVMDMAVEDHHLLVPEKPSGLSEDDWLGHILYKVS